MSSRAQRFKLTEAARLARAAKAAGLPVKTMTLKPDGTVVFGIGEPDGGPQRVCATENDWKEVLKDAPDEKRTP